MAVSHVHVAHGSELFLKQERHSIESPQNPERKEKRERKKEEKKKKKKRKRSAQYRSGRIQNLEHVLLPINVNLLSVRILNRGVILIFGQKKKNERK